MQLTIFCTQNREYNRAAHTGEKAMELAQLNEDKPLQITLLYNLGKGYTEILDAKKALEIFEKGLKLSQKNS